MLYATHICRRRADACILNPELYRVVDEYTARQGRVRHTMGLNFRGSLDLEQLRNYDARRSYHLSVHVFLQRRVEHIGGNRGAYNHHIPVGKINQRVPRQTSEIVLTVHEQTRRIQKRGYPSASNMTVAMIYENEFLPLTSP